MDEDKIFKLTLQSGHLMFNLNGAISIMQLTISPCTCQPTHLLSLTLHQPLHLDLMGLCLQRDMPTQ